MAIHFRSLVLALLFSLLAAVGANAASLTLAWDPNPEPNVDGYYVYIGTTSGVYSTVVDVGAATSYTYTSAVPGTTYYVTVAAYAPGPRFGPQATELVTTIGSGPTLTNPGNRSSSRGESVSLALTASDPDNGTLTFSAFGLPPGLSISSSTGRITGAPTTAGTFNVSVTVRDPSGETATQSFVWTIVTADVTAPTIIISGPTSATTYTSTSAFVTLTGTASDDVSVASVAWANSRGGSGTAAGTTSWSVVIPLQTGSNVLTVTARDGANRSSTDTITVTYSGGGPLTLTAITADRTAPQAPGTAITFTATATGGTAPYQYKWYVATSPSLSAFTVLQEWSTSPTLTWRPTSANANYLVGVLVRNAGSSVNAPDSTTAYSYVPFPISATAVPLTLTSLAADRTSPQPTSTTIRFTAIAAGGTSPYQFKWRLYNGTSWSVVQDWSTSATLAWTPTTANSSYRIEVWARSSGRTTDAAENGASASQAFVISAPATPQLSVTALTSNRTAPQTPSTAITFTAAATGGTAPYQYKWRLYNGSTWSTMQNWSTSSTVTWTPTAANSNYQVNVWVRSAGSTTDAAETSAASRTVTFPIVAASTPLSVTAVVTDKVAPQPVGSTVVFTARITGGVAPQQYKWWVYNGSTWTMARNWSTSSSFAWTPTSANSNYRMAVWARSGDSTADAPDNDASNASVAFPIVSAVAPLAVTSLTSDRTSPQPVGTSITFRATASGGTGPYSFKWRIYTGSTWITAQTWSTSTTFTLVPTTPGTLYQIQVWARSAGNTIDNAENGGSVATVPFTITSAASSGPLRLSNLTSNRSGTVSVGTPVTITASATGGVAPYQYKWWLYNGQQWVLLNNWTTSSTITWTPTARGSEYRIGVWIRSGNNSADSYENDASNGTLQFVVQ